ncbi:MAG: dihydropteroate synthase, partial [Geminicoccales bacterium]
MRLQCGRFHLELDRPVVMGVLNVTPDSFTDGGLYFESAAAVARGEELAGEGAAIIDVGGESTRPGSAPVGIEEELRRVIPVIERLAASLQVPVSVDTRKTEVMRHAIAAGASVVNDVGALAAPGSLDVLAGSGAGVVLVHMQGEPGT